ncbi:MAG: hypothetical protein LBD13_00400 [Spirochaetaceae bacterium]|jgi:hypothetical protein|nr:hypothetical protein [Spirochaetaceae bacterium]
MGCENLTTIIVDKQNPAYASVGGALFDKALETLIACPGGKTGAYAIPTSVIALGAESLA